ncbi:hypothetical protein RIR_jg9557.t2 [Rhizophagus irregularis DAOM 181602=DAOM 197198]|nr:hypothetical protein RIR_jg9557.t2 [Rhizophagus irregularis DAOM 181602=DAOM 197198]
MCLVSQISEIFTLNGCELLSLILAARLALNFGSFSKVFDTCIGTQPKSGAIFYHKYENKRVRNFVILCKTTDGKKQMGIGLKFFLDTIVSVKVQVVYNFVACS